jgi:hypothetical protein
MALEKNFLKDELLFIEQHVCEKSEMKAWFKEQFGKLGKGSRKPNLGEFFEEHDFLTPDEVANVEDIVGYGSLKGESVLYELLFSYLSGYAERGKSEEFYENAWQAYRKNLRERVKLVAHVKDLRDNLCRGNSVVSKEDFQRMFGRLKSVSGDADAAVVDHIKEEFLAISEKDEGTRKFFMAQRRMMILRMLKEDPKTTIEKLMHKLNCSARTIKRDIIVLENIDFLRRVGGRSDSGHWEVRVASLPSSKS